MNYYRRYVGDYLRDTARLSMLEHGAYNLLLDYYYAEEKPIPLEIDEIYRMVRAIMPEERRAVVKVLGLYFHKREDGYHNERADHEIAVSKKARENGKGGGRPRTGQETGSETGIETGPETGQVTGSQTEEGGGSGHPPTTNHQPPPATQKVKPVAGQKPGDVGKADKKREANEAAKRSIEYLNAQAGTKFRATETNIKFGADRMLYDGAIEQDLRAVVDAKVAESRAGDFEARYLRPETLWNKTKFASYIGLIGVTKAAPATVMVKAFAEREDGTQQLVIEYKANGQGAEAAARKIVAQHTRRFIDYRAKNIVLDNGRDPVRFSLEELEASA